MARGRMREAWDHTSMLLALIANVNRAPESSAVSAAYFHPFETVGEKRKDAEVTEVSSTEGVHMLCLAFAGPKPRKQRTKK